jgi:uncharacterized protein YdhG (YjbR/CyaY superfamily)
MVAESGHSTNVSHLLKKLSACQQSLAKLATQMLSINKGSKKCVIEIHMTKSKPSNVDEYIKCAPIEAQAMLREIRVILQKAAPKATEAIKWGSPIFEDGRILFSYKAYKSHINFMPTKPAMEPFMKELIGFKLGKDTIQLPYGQALPKALIRKIAVYRVKQVKDHDARWMYKEA